MYHSSKIILDESDKTTDPVKRNNIKQLSNLIIEYFDKNRKSHCECHIRNEYTFKHTESTIDGISLKLSIVEHRDDQFFNKPDNINKYGIFKIIRSPCNNNSEQIETELFKHLGLLFDFQNEIYSSYTNNPNCHVIDSNLEKDEKFIMLQKSIKDIINILNSNVSCPHPSYGQPNIPNFLRIPDVSPHPNFTRRSYPDVTSLSFIDEIFQIVDTVISQYNSKIVNTQTANTQIDMSQYEQSYTAPYIQPYSNTPSYQQLISNIPQIKYKYSFFATIPEEIKYIKHYTYHPKICCGPFMHLENGNCENYEVAPFSNRFDILEDAIEALQNTINTYKFFDNALLSPENFEIAKLQRELFPLDKDLNCCICLVPTMGTTECNHRICFSCRYKQITKNTDSKRFRCPTCRKKNVLNYFINNDDEQDNDP